MKRKQLQSSRKRIFIVDDHPIVREGLTTIINHEKDLEVCGEIDEAWEAFKSISELKPDVVIADIILKNSDGIELTKNLKTRYPKLPVIIFSVLDEFIYAERALRAGAQGYLMKRIASENIITAIRMVLKGEIYVSDTIEKKLLRKLSWGNKDMISTPMDCLSDRELEIFLLTGKGYKPSKMAQSMHLSVKTVETYRGRIKEKLNLSDADELIRYAIQWVNSSSKA